MPEHCQTFLSEVPILIEEKKRVDDQQREVGKYLKDPCAKAAALSISASMQFSKGSSAGKP